MFGCFFDSTRVLSRYPGNCFVFHPALTSHLISAPCISCLFALLFFFAVLGLEVRVYTLNHSASPFCGVFFFFFFRDRVSQNIFLGWLQTMILLISAFWAARSTGVRHWRRPCFFLFWEKLWLPEQYYQILVLCCNSGFSTPYQKSSKLKVRHSNSLAAAVWLINSVARQD
jgi:hypothetical protein